MNKAIYFFDSYAILEVLNGNVEYKKYKNSLVLTTKLNLFEVHHSILREKGEITAESTLQQYTNILDFDKKIIAKASILKLQQKKRFLSMTDCIGYTLAAQLGIPFLTGDKQFKDFENVEFVK